MTGRPDDTSSSKITVEDFIKLKELQENGFWIYCDEEQVWLCGLDEMEDEEELADYVLPEGYTDPRVMCCNFTFENDRYDTVCYLHEYDECEWTVMEPNWVKDWKNKIWQAMVLSKPKEADEQKS